MFPRFPGRADRTAPYGLAFPPDLQGARLAGHATLLSVISRRGDRLALLLVLLPMLLMGAGAILAWRQVWTDAARDLQHTADTVAQYGLRTFSTYAIAAGRIDAELAGLSDHDIRTREAELHARLRLLVVEVPQAEASFVLDRDGRILVAASVHPVPRDFPPFTDRDFYQALRAPDAPRVHVSDVHTGRLDGRRFFAVSRRRTRTGNPESAPGEFDGLVNLSAYPDMLGADLRALASEPEDVVSLIRRDGEVLARSVDPNTPRRVGADSPFGRLLAADVDRGVLELVPLFSPEPHLFALRRVPGWPIHASVGRPRSAVIRAWWGAVALQLVIAVPATVALLGLLALLRRNQAIAAAQTATLHKLFDTSAVALAESDASGRFLEVNQSACEMLGRSRTELLSGLTIRDITHPEDMPRTVDALRHAAADRADVIRLEKRFVRNDGSVFWGLVDVAVRRDAAGREIGKVAAVRDISDRKRAEAQASLMVRELDHRSKNLLAVVQAITRLTVKHDPAAYATAIERRIGSLARTHNLLTQDHWKGADLRQLALAELRAFDGSDAGANQTTLDGPPITLLPAAAQGLGMVLHELATNAAKYGAWSQAEGQVTLRWARDDAAGLVRLLWQERGGPPIAGAPTQRGFGSRVILATLRDQLGGTVEKIWDRAGMTCAIGLPIGRTVVPPASAA